MVEIIIYPTFAYVALAFGLQWYSPNGGMLRVQSTRPPREWRAEYRSEYPNWQNQYPNSGNYPSYGEPYYTTQGPYDYAGQQQDDKQ